MIKTFLLTMTVLAVSVLFAGITMRPVHAAFDPFGDACGGVSDSSVCNDKGKAQSTTDNSIYGPHGVLTKIVNLLSLVIGIAAVIMIIIAGIRFVLSSGDAARVASARNTILYAIVGLVVAVLSRSIVVFVLNKL